MAELPDQQGGVLIPPHVQRHQHITLANFQQVMDRRRGVRHQLHVRADLLQMQIQILCPRPGDTSTGDNDAPVGVA